LPAPTDIPGLMLRRAECRDSDVLAKLITQLGYPTVAGSMIVRMRALLDRPDDHFVIVAEWRGTVVGVIAAALSFHIEHDQAYGRITVLSVDEAHRSLGIGAVLLAYAEAWLRDRGAGICIVNSHIRRNDAHRFYKREGYRLTGYRLEK